VSETFKNAEFPQDLFHACFPLMSPAQFLELRNMGKFDISRDWVFELAAGRSCDCMLHKPCKNNATCFDQFNAFANASDYEENEVKHICLCVDGYTGPSCEIPAVVPDSDVHTFTFSNVNVKNTVHLVNDIKGLLSFLLKLHANNIQVDVKMATSNGSSSDPANSVYKNLRRRMADGGNYLSLIATVRSHVTLAQQLQILNLMLKAVPIFQNAKLSFSVAPTIEVSPETSTESPMTEMPITEKEPSTVGGIVIASVVGGILFFLLIFFIVIFYYKPTLKKAAGGIYNYGNKL
jgi:hypothetical protein